MQQPASSTMPTKNYDVVSMLGHGAQGSVYLVRDEDSETVMAAKVVSTMRL